ncbi:MAG: hypothetical protein E7157_00795 [Lactobacillales bacterium]|nr:hypothetical protein [Lactobacillales bacterium]
MKSDQKKFAIFLTLVIDLVIVFIVSVMSSQPEEEVTVRTLKNTSFYSENIKIINETAQEADIKIQEEIRKASIVYDNMTMEELSQKLEKSMNSSLNGKGELFATYSIELGLDPYLALAIVLHETGCSYNCSSLVKTHNNLGGLKAANGKYMSFNTLDEGIKGYLNILYKNYYSKGLTTPELMNPKYAASTTWASKVNWYIEKIKAK